MTFQIGAPVREIPMSATGRASCAHQTLVLPPEFTGWWLFELVPDHCEGA
jgi:hypothetical protein